MSSAFTPGPAVVGYDVHARNTAAGGAGNPIHDDEEARRHGYRSGLVPGVTTWAYLCHALIEMLGPGFVEHGSADLRLLAPVYDGDAVHVVARRTAEGTVEVVASVEPGGVVARATAWMQKDVSRVPLEAGWPLGPPGDLEDNPKWPLAARWPLAPPADERPAADETSLAPGRALGSVVAAVDEARGREYLETVGESSPWFEDSHVVHPGQLLQLANRALAANVVLGPWVHASSQVRHRTLARWGEKLEVRAKVHDRFKRKGHHFVALDVGIIRRRPGEGSDGVVDVVCEARHTAIFHLAR